MAASSATARSRTGTNKRGRQEERNQIPVLVPVDANGHPLTQISFAASDLVPTDDYANVIIGPVTVTRWFAIDPDDDEKVAEKTSELGSVVEGVLAEHREIVLTNLQAEAEKRLADAKK
jgi:hypothetical protein